MQNRPKLKHFLQYLLAFVLVVTVSFLIECVIVFVGISR